MDKGLGTGDWELGGVEEVVKLSSSIFPASLLLWAFVFKITKLFNTFFILEAQIQQILRMRI
jgi:hypothetical protein